MVGDATKEKAPPQKAIQQPLNQTTINHTHTTRCSITWFDEGFFAPLSCPKGAKAMAIIARNTASALQIIPLANENRTVVELQSSGADLDACPRLTTKTSTLAHGTTSTRSSPFAVRHPLAPVQLQPLCHISWHPHPNVTRLCLACSPWRVGARHHHGRLNASKAVLLAMSKHQFWAKTVWSPCCRLTPATAKTSGL